LLPNALVAIAGYPTPAWVNPEDIELVGYQSHAALKAPMAV
jgi:thymidylate synthase